MTARSLRYPALPSCTSEGGAVLCPLRAEAPGTGRATPPDLSDPARIR